MILKIKKRDLAVLLLVVISIPLTIIYLPVVYAYVGNVSATFIVTLEISNQVPTITWVLTGLSQDPVAGTTTIVYFTFNASDADGASDLNVSTAAVNITLLGPGGQSRANTSCTNISTSGTVMQFNCSVIFYYYDNQSSSWVINATIRDNNDALAVNGSENFTYNQLSAMSLVRASINFSGLNLGQNDQGATDNPLIMNNTGNDDFNQINVTGSDLVGVSDSGYVFGVGNFSVNDTNSALGVALINATPVTVTGATLTHGQPDTGNSSLFFYVDVPSSGLTPQLYNSTTPWVITVD